MRKNWIETSNKQRILYTVAGALVSLVIFISIIIFTYKNKADMSFPAVMALVILGLVIFFVGFWITVQGARKIGCFSCSNCNEEFTPSTMSYMRTAHLLKKSYLKCPKCGEKSWCNKIVK